LWIAVDYFTGGSSMLIPPVFIERRLPTDVQNLYLELNGQGKR